MKNFDYLKELPLFTTLYNQCDKAETFCKSDPDKSAMACRRALEWTVDLIYKVQHWDASPRASLFEKVQDSKFVGVHQLARPDAETAFCAQCG